MSDNIGALRRVIEDGFGGLPDRFALLDQLGVLPPPPSA